MNRVRKSKGQNALLAVLFAMTVAAAFTGATYSGVSKESSIDEACASVTWPAIPGYCLVGATDRPVRMVSVDRQVVDSMSERFAIAFE